MEKLVKVKTQSPLMSRDYTDARTGEIKKFHSVALVLSDGLDEFVAEITGEAALQVPTFDPNRLYAVSCYMCVRSWQNQQGQTQQATSIIVRQIKAI